MNNTTNIYNIVTNIKDKGKDVCFCVAADNPKNAIYVALDCKYNGKQIKDENITSVQLTTKRVVTSYYTDIADDLNPNYVAPPIDNAGENKQEHK